MSKSNLEKVIAGELETSALSAEEFEAWKVWLAEKMATPGPEEEAFFAEMRANGRGVGLDDAGNLVYADGRAVRTT